MPNTSGMKKLLPLVAAAFLTGCGSDQNVSTTVTVTPTPSPVFPAKVAPSPVLAPPRALNDRYWAVESEPITMPVLDNDELNGATLPEGQITDSGSTSRSFTYTLQNAAGSSSATVVLNRTPALHVDNQAAAGGDGSSRRPFNTLAAALSAANGRPTIFLVAQGTGTPQGLGDNYSLSPGQAVVGTSDKALPFFTGTFTLADNTQLKNLSFGVSGANGSVRGTGVRGVQLVNLQISDNGSLASAIQLSSVDDVGISNLALSNLPRSPVVLVNPGTQVSLNGVKLDGVNGGIVIQSQAGTSAVDLNKLTVANTTGAVSVSASQNANLTLSMSGCELKRGPGQSFLSVDVSGTANLKASLLDWHETPYQGPDGQAQLVQWTTRQSATTFLHVQGWNLETPATGNDRFATFPGFLDTLDFVTQDSARANLLFTGDLLYHTSGNNFNYPNAITITSLDQADVGIRFEQYKNGLTPKALRQNVPFNLVGHGSAQVRANVGDFLETRQDPSEFQGITPNFSFDGSSHLTAVYLFGVSYGSRDIDYLPGYHYQADWFLKWDNIGVLPVLNGTQMAVVQNSQGNYVLNTDPADYPNYTSVTDSKALNLPQP